MNCLCTMDWFLRHTQSHCSTGREWTNHAETSLKPCRNSKLYRTCQGSSVLAKNEFWPWEFYQRMSDMSRVQSESTKRTICQQWNTRVTLAVFGSCFFWTQTNGPPFNAHEFEKFAQAYGFEHVTSFPGYPQSSGKAENSVKPSKSTLRKAHHSGQDGYLALLELRNTPSEITVLLHRDCSQEKPGHKCVLPDPCWNLQLCKLDLVYKRERESGHVTKTEGLQNS